MKKEKNILAAFILNLAFSFFELAGGIFTGSAAILSDSIHDLGDAVSIGISYLLEGKSKKAPDDRYTYGYGRYSLLGGFITTSILVFGSVAVLFTLPERLSEPYEINYDGMLAFALAGVFVNSLAAFFTRDKSSANHRAVNLHMLEDVLGWASVLIGAAVMKLTGWVFIDSLLSFVIAVFILISALKNLKMIAGVFLERVPADISVDELKKELCKIEGVEGVHHFHIRSCDTVSTCAELHAVVSTENAAQVKKQIREMLREKGVIHVTVETERPDEACDCESCNAFVRAEHAHCHQHHHHH